MNSLIFKRFTLSAQPALVRTFSMLQSYQQPELFDYSFLTQEPQVETTLECKKNKTTKQAMRKRNKRKTGKDISIRIK